MGKAPVVKRGGSNQLNIWENLNVFSVLWKQKFSDANMGGVNFPAEKRGSASSFAYATRAVLANLGSLTVAQG